MFASSQAALPYGDGVPNDRIAKFSPSHFCDAHSRYHSETVFRNRISVTSAFIHLSCRRSCHNE
jgi:hypothetical protein